MNSYLEIARHVMKERQNRQVRPEPLEAVLRGRAVELWSDAFGRLFIVADDADVQRLIKSDPEVGRGEVYTAAEVRRVIRIADPLAVAEVHHWKREFNGTIREVEANHDEETRKQDG